MKRDSRRRRQALHLALLAGMGSVLLSCTLPTKEEPSPAVIEGRIVEQGSEEPISNALIEVPDYLASTRSDVNGNFSLTIALPDTTSRLITLVISREGYRTDSLRSLIIKNDKVLSLGSHRLSRERAISSGPASNVVLVAVETNTIYVKGSGGNETADLTFEVRDASGTPVDLKHRVTLNFSIRGGPGGGEFLNPTSAETDSAGRAIVTVNSGTLAGALQIVASIAGQNLFSAPIPIAIHGGLPDAAHFSVVPNRLNFAGYNLYGLTNVVTAFVGDKYSNPVPPGTSVYFRSTGGLIGGSAVTDEMGRATVTLLSASPQPQGIPGAAFPFSERGFARIEAQTVDANDQTISTSTVVLFSGRTQVDLSPRTFRLEPQGVQLFNYTVSDQNLNPLVAGTTIKVGTDIGKVTGITEFTLEDTQSRAYTNFSFVLTNSQPDSFLVKTATLTIEVNSPNGNAKLTATGEMLPIVR
ncbi:MAG: hypothetical protein ONB48_09210 [candidate division KSB1 bacterium]|nr:hypothetical protein [candidate division KSB1 bacterium]MDZ7273665.1 hypothetical protein [candidate division KSB1 bacterium]MDZ7285821.1 hypothetical protein [candidate division KSB1 bacterium]MDZ7298853.1 hypothetical protein [candidate division KSB1 bacterium]MDZ7308574.1 hypothetical protein [candidate division KSB1 bacterium]